MWKFSGLEYKRPDDAKLQEDYAALTKRFKEAATYDEAKEAFIEQDKIIASFETMSTIASIRQTLNTLDKFYEDEMAFIHRAEARFMPLRRIALEALCATPFKADFVREFGEQLFIKAKTEISTKSDAIVSDLIEESDLEQEYKLIAASCKVDFMGETRNFYGLLKFMENPDRNIRKAAFIEWAKLYEGVSDKLDEVYDKLIKVRLRIAEKLGFKSYIDLAYANKNRVDYDSNDVAAFRKQIRDIVVPAVARFREEQRKRIGVDKLRYYDETFMFTEGNADPIGGEDVLVPIAKRMYNELSPETGEFFEFLTSHGLYDLETRNGKHLGGYCTALPDFKAPYIFSNFNGTAADVGVLTHEAGHAFAGYEAAREQKILDYGWSTSEINEIHSMAMEHFTYPWLKDMFGEANEKKARYTHLCDALMVLPYLVSVDEFQHRVFENPTMSAKERRAVWHEIETIYLPWRDYDGNAFLAEGGFWMQKQHIFLYPFYYIDYALAQTCAFELYGRMKTDNKQAWQDYLRLCKAGGSLGYFDLLKLANLSNPFKEGSVAKATRHVVEELEGR